MSRIGKIPVDVPKGVKVFIERTLVCIEGPKGKLSLNVPLGITVENKEDKLYINRVSNAKQNKSNHGTIKVLLANVITGVTQGHKKELEIQGVGYRAQVQDKKLELNLGLSHSVEFAIPDGVSVKARKPTELEIEGIDKTLVGNTASKIRDIKPPEPYKGKGIRFVGEVVKRKQGKSVAK